MGRQVITTITRVWDKAISYVFPISVTSEPGARKGVRFQRFRLHPEFYVTIHEDGRIRVEAPNVSFSVRNLHNHGSGSSTINILWDKNDLGDDE